MAATAGVMSFLLNTQSRHTLNLLRAHSQAMMNGAMVSPSDAFSITSIESQLHDARNLQLAALITGFATLYVFISILVVYASRTIRRHRNELASKNADLQTAAAIKDQFLSNMSHELRTPLNAVIGLSEILEDGLHGEVNAKQRRSLTLIHESGEHLLELINDILDVSKIAAGRIQLTKELISVREVCEAALSMVEASMRSKDIPLELSLDPGAEAIVGDRRRVLQISINYLTNAVKFTPAGRRVGLETSAQTEGARFTVWDEGVGIGADDTGKVFEPFVQVDNKLSRNFEGSGFGLALSKQLAELHGGVVGVESRIDEGSRFSVILPWRQDVNGDPADTSRHEAVAPVDVRDAADGPSPTPAHILVVEDNPVNAEMISDVLRAKGHQVEVVRDGKSALEEIPRNPPQLVLLDIQIPGIDGLQVLRSLRARPQFKDLPIVAITALAMPGDRERCLEAGATDYMAKPLSLPELNRVIAELLRTRQGMLQVPT